MSITTISLVESMLLHDRPVFWAGLDTADPLIDDSGHGYTLTAVGSPSNSASLHTRGDTGASGSRDFNGTTGAYDVFGTITGPGEGIPVYPEFLPTWLTANNATDTVTMRTPGGTEVGDLMIAVLLHDTNTATITTPDADWTLMGAKLDYTAGAMYGYKRIATSADVPATLHTWIWSASGPVVGNIVSYRGYDSAVAGAVFDFGFQATSSYTAHTTSTESHPDAAIQLVIWGSDVNRNIIPEAGGTTLQLFDAANGNTLTPAFGLIEYRQQFAGSGNHYAHSTPTDVTMAAGLITFGAPDEVLEDALDTIASNVTIHCLANLDTVSGTDTIIRKHQAWGLNLVSGQLRFQYRDGGGIDRTVNGPTLTTGTTYRIWVVDDGTNINFYVNGTKTTAARSGTAGYAVNTNRVTIGAYHNGTTHTEFLDGRLDEVAVFPAALSEEMVRAHELAHTQGIFGDFLHGFDPSGRYPRAKVELALDSEPTDPCPVFIDVNSVQIKSGGPGHGIRTSAGLFWQSASRDFEQDRMQAGTLMLTLGNRDGRYSDLNPWRVIRYRTQAAVDGPVFPHFYGITEAPPYNRGAYGRDSTVMLRASDGFFSLALSVMQEEKVRPIEYPGTRLEDVLEDVAGLQFSLDEGQHQLAAEANLQGTSRLEHCQAVAETDGGIFFCDGRGRMVFQDAHHRSKNERSVRATYGWLNTSASFPVKEMQPMKDESRLFTAAEVTPSSGNTQRAVYSQTSLAVTRTLTTLHELDNDALALAHHIANRYSQPLDRIPNLVLQPAGYDPSPRTMWATVLSHEISHRIRTIEKPIGEAVEVSREHFIEGMTHRISASDWHVSLILSPVEIDGNYFIIGTDQIGSTTRLIGY